MSQFPNNERGIRHGANMGGVTYGESPASGPAPTTAGHHKHDILNKLDPRVDSTQDRRPMPQNNNVPAGTYGPHSSRIANILDPRVDSDMSRGGPATAGAGAGATMHTAGMGSGAPEGTYGPHRSRVANAMDPRVDSDMDNCRYPTGAAAAGAAGPGYGPGMTGTGGYGNTTGGIGHYQQQPATYGTSAAEPRHGVAGGNPAMSGPGPAPNTAGPHKSDLLNKLDPRVDNKTGMSKTERRGI